MKQEEILVESRTDNTALETQMNETIGITGGIASILTGVNGNFETLGSICAGVMENTSSIFSIGQAFSTPLAAVAEGSGSSVSLLGQMTDGVTQLVIASDKLCDGVLKLVENTAQIFHSIPNEGARYGKLGPTKIRAEPYIGQYDKMGRRKVIELKNNSHRKRRLLGKEIKFLSCRCRKQYNGNGRRDC